MDPELQKKLKRFCTGLEDILPHMPPFEQIIGRAILEYWKLNKPDVAGTALEENN